MELRPHTVWSSRLGIFAPIAFLYLVSVLGLWRARRWGWWLGFLVNLGVTVALLYSLIDDGWANSDATDIALPLVTIALLIYYWIRGSSQLRSTFGSIREGLKLHRINERQS